MPARTSSVIVLASRKPSPARKPPLGIQSSLSRKKSSALLSFRTQGVVYIEQPEAACLAVEEAVARIAYGGRAAPFALPALSRDDNAYRFRLDRSRHRAWRGYAHRGLRAAHVDDDFEMRVWGEDAEASRRRARVWREMEAAAGLFQLVHDSDA